MTPLITIDTAAAESRRFGSDSQQCTAPDFVSRPKSEVDAVAAVDVAVGGGDGFDVGGGFGDVAQAADDLGALVE